MRTLKLDERYHHISGPMRDEFINQIMDMRDETEEDILLDFSGVDGISSIALAAVGKLHTWMEERKRRLVIKGLNDHLYELFEITGLAQMLEIEDHPRDQQQ